ncbi:YopX family protein [Staphylococcus equorum]|uniref:YopX family protein n=1 Tax=Staphylococcus equorum TaxID=246432 RepID=UPI0025545DCF|nr:YopX family protein [Staphylococcus equorum]MDK9859260.1 YopX family protein [Staphylococcus equorum]
MIPKFRAYLKERPYLKGTGIVVDVQEINYRYKEIVYENEKYMEVADFKDVILLQFTGLKDYHDVDIFEGDIISCEIETIEKFIICERCGCFGIRDKIDGFISLNSINETLSIHKEFEVMGNIYEHPYLIEE